MVPTGVIGKFPLFHGLTQEELEAVAMICREEVYEAGAILYEEGERIDRVYIVERGKVALEIKVQLGPWGPRRQRVVQLLTSGQVFGWSAIVAPHVMKLGATCVEPSGLVTVLTPETWTHG